MDLQFHELANLFPMMGGHEFESFVRDIKQNGLTNPTILLHSDGRILDGRNRYAACMRLGIEVKTETFAGDDKAALAHVVSVNLERRQLTTSQRTAIAAEVETLKHGDFHGNQHTKVVGAKLHLPDSSPRSGVNTRDVGKSRQEAADMMKVSKRSVADAALVKRKAPHIHEMVKSGEVNVNTARMFVSSADTDSLKAAVSPQDVKARSNAIRYDMKARGEARESLGSNPRLVFAKVIRATKELAGIASDLAKHAYLPNHRFSQISIREISDRLGVCCAKLVELTSKE